MSIISCITEMYDEGYQTVINLIVKRAVLKVVRVCMYVCMCVCMCVYVCICVCVYMYVYTHTHTHTHIYMYMYMCVCVCVCVCYIYLPYYLAYLLILLCNFSALRRLHYMLPAAVTNYAL